MSASLKHEKRHFVMKAWKRPQVNEGHGALSPEKHPRRMRALKAKRASSMAALLVVCGVALAAASQGLKWSASTKYEDGSALEADAPVVYLVFDSTTNKQVASSRTTSLAASSLPIDGCYYLKGALYSKDINGIVPASESLTNSPTVCTRRAPPTVQKRVAAPTTLELTP